MSLRKFEKQPGDNLDYDIVFEEFFGDDDDFIESSANVTATISAPGGTAPHLELSRPPIALGDIRAAKVWLEGGVDSYTYKVTVTVETHKGRIKEQDFLVKVKEL